MTTTQERRRAWRGPALFSFGFRPFFLGAALWAALSMVVWLAMIEGRSPLPIHLDPPSWHAHEFLFGYLSAVIAGFLLTAVPNWTGRLPVVGWPLAALSGLWLAGRIAIAIGAHVPAGLVAAVDLAFPVALAVFLACEILAGRNWKNLIVLTILLAFVCGNAIFHIEAAQGDFAAQGVGLRLGLAASVMLVSVIGGRIVPSFTRNWLVKSGLNARPRPPMQGFDRIVLFALLMALLAWVAAPVSVTAGLLLLMAGVLHVVRLIRWCGHQTIREPLVWVLHLAYVFVPLGGLGTAFGILFQSSIWTVAGLHIWTVGAIGLMTLAVMTRATLGHTGAALHAGSATAALYLFIVAAVLLRILSGFASTPGAFLMASGLCWCMAYLGFVLVYGPRLLLPRR